MLERLCEAFSERDGEAVTEACSDIVFRSMDSDVCEGVEEEEEVVVEEEEVEVEEEEEEAEAEEEEEVVEVEEVVVEEVEEEASKGLSIDVYCIITGVRNGERGKKPEYI